MQPLVSVVIPSYNAERFIRSAIKSVLEQSYRNVEVIVVDDGSTDRTAAGVESFGNAVTLIRQQRGGPSRARNRGIGVARGRYLAFLDADDAWDPRKLDVQVERLERGQTFVASFVGATHENVATGLRTAVHPAVSTDPVRDMLLRGTTLGPTSCLALPRGVLERIGGFDPATDQSEDLDIALRLAGAGPIDLVPEPLVTYRVHGSNSSRNARRMEASWLAILRKFYADEANARRYGILRGDAYANLNLVVAGSYLDGGQVRAAIRCVARALLYKPALVARIAKKAGRRVLLSARRSAMTGAK